MQRRFGDPDLDADVKFGDIVTIRIPPNLRGPVDEPFIVCVVVEKFETLYCSVSSHIITTSHDLILLVFLILCFQRFVIDVLYRTCDVGRVARHLGAGEFGLSHCLNNWVSMDKASLATAARMNSSDPQKGPISRCNCRGGCNTDRCRCRKVGLNCSTKCHPTSSTSCCNKSI